jgi:UTRA domain
VQRLVEQGLVTRRRGLASVLALAAGAAVLSVERLRLADGTPLAIMHNY